MDSFLIVNSLPTTNISSNVHYLIASSIDDTGGGGDVTVLTYSISRVNGNIVLTGSDGSTSSAVAGLTQSEVEDVVDDIINDYLGVAY